MRRCRRRSHLMQNRLVPSKTMLYLPSGKRRRLRWLPRTRSKMSPGFHAPDQRCLRIPAHPIQKRSGPPRIEEIDREERRPCRFDGRQPEPHPSSVASLLEDVKRDVRPRRPYAIRGRKNRKPYDRGHARIRSRQTGSLDVICCQRKAFSGEASQEREGS